MPAKLLQSHLFVTLWIVAHQASLSMGFSRQEYWCRLPFLPTGDLANPMIEPASPVSPALSGGFFTTSTTWEALAAFAQLQFSDPLGCEGKPNAPTPVGDTLVLSLCTRCKRATRVHLTGKCCE